MKQKKENNKMTCLQWYCKTVWNVNYVDMYDILSNLGGMSDKEIDDKLIREYRGYLRRSQGGDNLIKTVWNLVHEHRGMVSKSRNKYGLYIAYKKANV